MNMYNLNGWHKVNKNAANSTDTNIYPPIGKKLLVCYEEELQIHVGTFETRSDVRGGPDTAHGGVNTLTGVKFLPDSAGCYWGLPEYWKKLDIELPELARINHLDIKAKQVENERRFTEEIERAEESFRAKETAAWNQSRKGLRDWGDLV